MKPKGKAIQLAMHCRCGREAMLAQGMCATCYTLRRQDEEHFGGLREMVLERDGYRCRVCDAPGNSKRSITVHHRVPAESKLHLMISLCPGWHARVHRTLGDIAIAEVDVSEQIVGFVGVIGNPRQLAKGNTSVHTDQLRLSGG